MYNYLVYVLEKCGIIKPDQLIYKNTTVLDKTFNVYYPIYKIETPLPFTQDIPDSPDMPEDYCEYFKMFKIELKRFPKLYQLEQIKTIVMKRDDFDLLQITRTDIDSGKILIYDYEETRKYFQSV